MKQCTYCGSSKNIQDDHIRAQSKGGVKTTPACAACNQSKGRKPLMEWLRWIKQNDKYRWNRIRSFHFGKKKPISIKIQKVRDEK